MSDDLTGQPPQPPPSQPPVFLPPHAGPPMPPPTPTPSPAPAPTVTGADGWPWYFGLLALLIGLVATVVVSLIVTGIWLLAGGHEEDATLIVVATALQSLIFVATVVALARSRGPVTFADFGLVRAPFWPTVGKMALTIGAYFVILATYSAAVHLKPDSTPDELGANSGVLGMLFFGILVAVIAPISEEIFFRGMVFRSFANGIGVWGGAIASGILFGSLHIDSFANERLLQVVPLALLGVMFALLYAWSGTLYSTIALHATNNALAVLVYADDKHSDFGVALAVVLWVLMMIGCTLGWKLTDKRVVVDVRTLPPPTQPPSYMPPPAPPQSQPQSQPQPEHPDFPWGQP